MAKTAVKAAPAEPDYKAVADAIAAIGDASNALSASGLSRRAVLALLKDATGVSKQTLALVLDAQKDLTRWCLSK